MEDALIFRKMILLEKENTLTHTFNLFCFVEKSIGKEMIVERSDTSFQVSEHIR